MLDLSDYPKKVRLRKGDEVIIRLLTPGDEAALIKLMNELLPEDKVYFRDDVSDPAVVRRWCQNINLNSVLPLVALSGDQIIADWSLHQREFGWTRHLVDIRGVVHPVYRQMGLGAKMVYELLTIAQRMEKERAVVHLARAQKKLLARFIAMGFSVEVVLKNWIKDSSDRYQDMLILSMKIEPIWKEMENMVMESDSRGR